MADYQDDTMSVHSKASMYSEQTTSEFPTTPPPEYEEDITPRNSFALDRDTNVDVSTVPGLSFLPQSAWSSYRAPHSTLSRDRTTVTTNDELLLSSAGALTEFIRAQCALPPFPEIRIAGHSSDSTSLSTAKQVDFDIRLKLLQYLIPSKTSRSSPSYSSPTFTPNIDPFSSADSSFNHIRVRASDGTTWLVGTGKNDDLQQIRAIAEAFVADKQNHKCLVIERRVTNWDKAYLKGCILSLLSDLRYRGNVSVTFPLSHAKIVVEPARTVADSFKSLFYEKTTYAGIEAVWQYANEPPPGDQSGGQSSSSSSSAASARAEMNAARTFAVRSEQGWWNDWKGGVERAVLEGKKGNVGVDDLLEIAVGFRGPERRWKDWGS